MDRLIALDKQLLLFLNGSDSVWLDNFWWTVTRTATWIPLLVLILYVVWRNVGWRRCLFFGLMIGLVILLADRISSGIIKPLVCRPRPTHDPEIGMLVDVVRGHRGGRYGFVSSHAANTFGVATFASLFLRQYIPVLQASVRKRRWVTFGLFFWAVLCSYSRIYLGVHYPGDILCGALLGVLIGWGVARFTGWLESSRKFSKVFESFRKLSPCLVFFTLSASAQDIRPVAPLLQSIRHQSEPFNLSCPWYNREDGTRSRVLSGCVATCLEQVMSYWKYPEALIDTLHGWETAHYTVPDVLPGTRIDWDNILPDYSGTYTEEQGKAVADLTYYCGMAAHMNWKPESSGASLHRAFEPLWKAFDYKTVAFVQRCLYSDEAWHRLLRNELENGRPICYTGHNMALSGHAFNIDGIDEQGRYHLNWGYGGDYDGYFDLDALNPFESPDDSTQLGYYEGFHTNQTALFMHPEDFVIDVYDTLGISNALYGVEIETVAFRRSPDTQCYTVADLTLRNTTEHSLCYTFEALTYLPTDTAVFEQADYVAVSSVHLAPGEQATVPVYCQFAEAGERLFAISTDDRTFAYEQPLTIGQGTRSQLAFSDVTARLVDYGGDLTAELHLNITNTASMGVAGDLVTYCLFPQGNEVDTRHWEVLQLPAGETHQATVRFRHLQLGQTYTLRVRCPWAVQREITFSVVNPEDGVEEVARSADGSDASSAATYDLRGLSTARPQRGIYIKHGKKLLLP